MNQKRESRTVSHVFENDTKKKRLVATRTAYTLENTKHILKAGHIYIHCSNLSNLTIIFILYAF